MQNQLEIPKEVQNVMTQMIQAGYEIYLVGGVVRDFLLGKHTDDYDFATNARPEQIKEIFSNYYIMDYGQDHGTIALYHNELTFEITTYRIEESYSDGRRPDNVGFVDDLKLDLDRRDFTINALAADINGQIIDYHGGIDDFKNGIIRCVGDPMERFSEDSLRVLRAIRFSLRLDFVIEEETYAAMISSADLLKTHSVSGERIQSELKEIMEYTQDCIELLIASKVFEVLFVELHDDEEQFLISKSKLLRNSEFHSWGLILYLLFSKNIDISSLFEQYPGYGKQKEDQFINLAQWIDNVVSVVNCFDLGRLLRIGRDSSSSLTKYPDFNLAQYLNSLFDLAEVISVKNLQISNIIRQQTIAQLQRNLPVDGHVIKKYGFSGRNIGIMLDYLNRLNIHLIDKTLDFDRLIKEIIDNDPVRMKHLVAYIVIDKLCLSSDTIDELISLLEDRLQLQNTLHIVISQKEHEQIVIEFLSKSKINGPMSVKAAFGYNIKEPTILENYLN